MLNDRTVYAILYHCSGEPTREHTPFVSEHALTCILAGEMHIQTPAGLQIAPTGSIGLIRRNQLLKARKQPALDGPFRSISVILSQAALRTYAHQQVLAPMPSYQGPALLPLPNDPFLRTYFQAVLPYLDSPEHLTPILAELKTQEAIALLLREPLARHLLLDFQEPFKVELEHFMQRHFMYNVPLPQFAYLSGRSLATFKRDFQRVFQTSPEKWLRQRRLEQAYYLIQTHRQRPSDVYLEVGFENFSHFCRAFKHTFGHTASEVLQHSAAEEIMPC